MLTDQTERVLDALARKSIARYQLTNKLEKMKEENNLVECAKLEEELAPLIKETDALIIEWDILTGRVTKTDAEPKK